MSLLFGWLKRKKRSGESRAEIVSITSPADESPSLPFSGFKPWELKWLVEFKCPDCHENGFFEGPSGGMSTNYKCANMDCGSEFNIAVVGYKQILGERISTPSPLKKVSK